MANVYFKLEKATIGVGGFKSLIVEVTPADDLLIGVPSDDVKLNKEGKKVVALDKLKALLQPLHDTVASSVPGSEPADVKPPAATELDEDPEEDEPKPAKKAKAEKPIAKIAKKKKDEDEDDDLGDLDDDEDEDDDLGELDEDEDEKPAKKTAKKEAPVAKKTAKKPAKEDDEDMDDLAELLAD